MSFLEIFDRDYLPKLNCGPFLRGATFRRMISHLEEAALKNGKVTIIETGTSRKKGNWSDGQSTLIWDSFLEVQKGECFSLDINEENITVAKSQTKNVSYLLGDAVTMLYLLEAVPRADLLYLDSFDLDRAKPQESSLHHLMELTSVWSRLKSGCLVVVDDCVSDSCGKHMYVKKYMGSLGIEPAFTGYQYGWIVP